MNRCLVHLHRQVTSAWLLATALTVLLAGAAAARAGPPPRVVVSLKPLHGLAAAVMQGVGRPSLLVSGARSPHTYSLKPSEALALSRADLVVWVGPTLESFLVRPLRGLSGKGRELRLIDAPGVRVLPVREAGAWAGHARGEDGHGEDDHDGRGHDGDERDGGERDGVGPPAAGHVSEMARDPHIWLDPDNAGAIVRALAARLSGIDPARAPRYAANRDAVLARIAALDAQLRDTLAPVRDAPHLVFHDAYQYFERHYALNAVGALTLSPDRPPSARRLLTLRRRLRESGARCVFREPQFPPSLVATLIEDTPARGAVLDPLGAGLAAGPEAWFTLMRAMARDLQACLARP